jgi:ATP-dependent Lhr-like helicase
LTRRAAERLDEVRERFAWVDGETTAVVRGAEGRSSWWTFAGLRANASLAAALGPLRVHSNEDENLMIGLRPDVDAAALRAHLDAVSARPSEELLPEVVDEALDGLKFSACLPPALARRVVSRRLADPEAVAACLAERVRDVVVGA